MDATLRKVGALVRKDACDLVRNPSMLVCVLMPVGFTVLFRLMLGDVEAASGLDEARAGMLSGTLDTFLLSISLCMAIGMVIGMVEVYGIAEEKEKHTLRTLMLANVGPGQVMASRALVALVVTLAVAAASFLLLGKAGVELLPVYLGLCVLGALPTALVSLVLGLASRDQMTAGLYSVPVVLVSLVPMFRMASRPLAEAARWLPTGAMSELVGLMMEGRMLTSEALVPLAVALAWTAAAAVAFALLFRRLVRDN